MERKNERLPKFTERFRKLQGKQSNTEFSDFLGISRQSVGFYLNGDRVPDALTLAKIAEKCEVSTDWLLGLSDIRSKDYDVQQICKATGLSEESITELCGWKKWGVGIEEEAARVIDALIFDFRYETKGESFAPLVYLLNWFLKYEGNEKIEKQVHISGKIIDCNDQSSYLASTIKLNNRIVENAALMEIQQALISLKKRLAGKEREK